MSTESIFEGGCLCGAVRWRATGEPLYAYHCHCRMCQRQSGAGIFIGVTFPFGAVHWLRGEPRLFPSSENAKRGFCARCGSSISWKWNDEKLSLAAGSFDHPEGINPNYHVFTETQVPWSIVDDALPRYTRYPPEIGSQDQEL